MNTDRTVSAVAQAVVQLLAERLRDAVDPDDAAGYRELRDAIVRAVDWDNDAETMRRLSPSLGGKRPAFPPLCRSEGCDNSAAFSAEDYCPKHANERAARRLAEEKRAAFPPLCHSEGCGNARDPLAWRATDDSRFFCAIHNNAERNRNRPQPAAHKLTPAEQLRVIRGDLP